MLSSVSIMKNTLNSLVATYQILLMTINRCTDFTKTSHKIPLTPTLETINFAETITAPISCVSDLQCRVNIEVTTDEKINSTIITDRQWLQDNLLCLVSNAVKYSKEGTTATVKVLLCDLHSLGPVDLLDSNLNINHVHTHVDENTSNKHLVLRFEVADTGDGLKSNDNHRCLEGSAVEDLNTLFQEPDFTHRKELGGSGLGLHCLAKRIEALRGQYGIQPRNDCSHGMLVWFSIPYVPVFGPPAHLLQQEESKPASSKSASDLHSSPPKKWFEDGIVIEHAQQRKSNVGSVLSAFGSDNAQTSIKDEASVDADDFAPVPLVSSLTTEGALSLVQSQKSERDTKSRLLVVDDSLPILKMLKIMLEKDGHEVITAVNGLEAVQCFQTSMEEKVNSQHHSHQSFDAILMDIQMPVMGGIEAITQIREYEKFSYPLLHLYPHHLIVAMSAGSDDETLEAIYKAGADEFLSKPFNLQSFKKILHNFQEEHIKDKETELE
jgi:CheY-like chemotaxis protein